MLARGLLLFGCRVRFAGVPGAGFPIEHKMMFVFVPVRREGTAVRLAGHDPGWKYERIGLEIAFAVVFHIEAENTQTIAFGPRLGQQMVAVHKQGPLRLVRLPQYLTAGEIEGFDTVSRTGEKTDAARGIGNARRQTNRRGEFGRGVTSRRRSQDHSGAQIFEQQYQRTESPNLAHVRTLASAFPLPRCLSRIANREQEGKGESD